MAINNGGTLPGGQRAQGKRVSQADILENRRKAVTLRQAGATYEEIARTLGYNDRSNARKAVLRALEDHLAEDVSHLRAMQNARYLRLLRVVWADAIGGDGDAYDRAMRTMDAMNRLNGLNAPTRIEVTDEMDREIATLAASLTDDGSWNVTNVAAMPDTDISTEGG